MEIISYLDLVQRENGTQVQKGMNFGIKGEVYNVGNGKPMTNRDLLKSILNEKGLKYNFINIQNTKSKNAEVKSIYADITKLKKLKS